MMRAAAFGDAEAVSAMELQIEPQQQTVHAAVVVRVAITEPTALA